MELRGKVGTAPITPEFMLKLGWGKQGRVFKEKPIRRFMIGKDTRNFWVICSESALEAGIVAAVVLDVRLVDPMPTPAIALLDAYFSR